MTSPNGVSKIVVPRISNFSMSYEIIQNMFFSMHVLVRNLRQPRLSCFLAILNATLLLPFYEANGCCPISLLN